MRGRSRFYFILCVLPCMMIFCGKHSFTPDFEFFISAPTNLSAGVVSSTQIDLVWEDNAGNETGTVIERKCGSENYFVSIDSVAENVETYSDTQCSGTVTYQYRVKAYNSDGESDYSNTASATTIEAAVAVPEIPSNLVLTTLSEDQVKITWKDNSTNEDGFRIGYNQGSGNVPDLSQFIDVEKNTTEYILRNLQQGADYWIGVAAYNDCGQSNYITKKITIGSSIETLQTIKDATLHNRHSKDSGMLDYWNLSNDQGSNKIGTDMTAAGNILNTNYYKTVIYFGDLSTHLHLKGLNIKSACIRFFGEAWPQKVIPIALQELTSPGWSESSVTQDNLPTIYSNSKMTLNSAVQGDYFYVDMTKALQLIMAYYRTHGGYVIFWDGDYADTRSYYQLSTRENSHPDHCPVLIIEYE